MRGAIPVPRLRLLLSFNAPLDTLTPPALEEHHGTYYIDDRLRGWNPITR